MGGGTLTIPFPNHTHLGVVDPAREERLRLLQLILFRKTAAVHVGLVWHGMRGTREREAGSAQVWSKRALALLLPSPTPGRVKRLHTHLFLLEGGARGWHGWLLLLILLVRPPVGWTDGWVHVG